MRFLALLLALAASAFEAFGETPLQTTKSSDTHEFDAAAEVKAYYLKLIATNRGVRRQFESLAKRSPAWGDVHSRPADPQVVAWYPRQVQLSVAKGLHGDERFLVIQPIEFGRQTWKEYNFAVVSEFRVFYTGEARMETIPEGEGHYVTRFLPNKITIQFLGFREISLKSVKSAK